MRDRTATCGGYSSDIIASDLSLQSTGFTGFVREGLWKVVTWEHVSSVGTRSYRSRGSYRSPPIIITRSACFRTTTLPPTHNLRSSGHLASTCHIPGIPVLGHVTRSFDDADCCWRRRRWEIPTLHALLPCTSASPTPQPRASHAHKRRRSSPPAALISRRHATSPRAQHRRRPRHRARSSPGSTLDALGARAVR